MTASSIDHRHRPPPRRRLPVVAALLVLVPPIITALLVARWGVDVPFWDQWDLLPQLAALEAGTLTVADLWQPHNEHRLLLPRLVMLALAQLSQWDVRWEMALCLLLADALLVLLVVLVLHARTRPTSTVHPAALPLLSLLVFSPGQWENWIWGWQIQIFLSVLAVVAGLAILATAPAPLHLGRLAAAALLGVVASYSFGTGLLYWPAALPLVWGERRGRPTRLGTWALVALATGALYAYPAVELGDGETVARILGAPLHFGAYICVFLGAPLFAVHGKLALYGGFAGASLFTGIVLRLAVRHTLFTALAWPWLCLSAYAAASAVLIASGRFHHGIGQGLSARYITLGNLFWIGLGGLLSLAFQGHRTPIARRAPWLLTAAATACLLATATAGASHMAREHAVRTAACEALRHGGDPERIAPLYPNPQILAQRAETLRALGLSCLRSTSGRNP